MQLATEVTNSVSPIIPMDQASTAGVPRYMVISTKNKKKQVTAPALVCIRAALIAARMTVEQSDSAGSVPCRVPVRLLMWWCLRTLPPLGGGLSVLDAPADGVLVLHDVPHDCLQQQVALPEAGVAPFLPGGAGSSQSGRLLPPPPPPISSVRARVPQAMCGDDSPPCSASISWRHPHGCFSFRAHIT